MYLCCSCAPGRHGGDVVSSSVCCVRACVRASSNKAHCHSQCLLLPLRLVSLLFKRTQARPSKNRCRFPFWLPPFTAGIAQLAWLRPHHSSVTVLPSLPPSLNLSSHLCALSLPPARFHPFPAPGSLFLSLQCHLLLLPTVDQRRFWGFARGACTPFRPLNLPPGCNGWWLSGEELFNCKQRSRAGMHVPLLLEPSSRALWYPEQIYA
jgi:hypothetical protein